MGKVDTAVRPVAESSDTVPATTVRPRFASLDILRGLVMVLMVLDHCRHHLSNVAFDPTDLANTNAPLFLTRWVTHFCAPAFVLAAGISAYLSLKNRPGAARFLLTRGLWLIALEALVVRFGWHLTLSPARTVFQVIWAIGAGFITLAIFVQAPAWITLTVGAIIVVGHNLLNGTQVHPLLHGGPWIFENGWRINVFYPALPWVGLMLLGFGLGRLYDLDRDRRVKALWQLAAGCAVAFVILRGVNLYGDPASWAGQSNAPFTILSFVNVTKYPASLSYMLLTSSVALAALAMLDRRRCEPLEVIGRVPLFFYLAHLALIQILGLAIAFVRFGGSFPQVRANYLAHRFDLPMVYLATVIVTIALYPVCRAFGRYKSGRRSWWLRYL